ncbi:MAG: hypothetical protein ACOCUY_02415 [Verrucomicrobiota bacterium]
MPKSIQEGNLIFTFEDPWHVVKYDEEAVFTKKLERLKGTVDGKQRDTVAVDFLAANGDMLAIIEVKDFRQHRIENQGRLRSGELAKEVAFKVRDTLAGIVAACRNQTTGPGWDPIAERLMARTKTLKVVLWLEQDPPASRYLLKEKQMLSTFTQELKKRCKWLTPKVLVMNRNTHCGIPGLSVQDAPE